MSYYDDISAGSSDDHGSLESDEEQSHDDDQEWLLGRGRAGGGKSESSSTPLPTSRCSTLATGLWDRSILHLDVDCFYCQCEEIDRGLRKQEPIQPLAIGQKHIIVTSNYEARKYGVQKLQLRDAAYKACPHLWIVEGSDLMYYRRHSRAIYEAFRAVLQDIAQELGEGSPFQIPSRKGCMDEMMADLTPAVERILSHPHGYQSQEASDPDQSRFVFGEDGPSSMAVLVEDQTGQKSVVSFKLPANAGDLDPQEAALAPSRRNIHNVCGATERDRSNCRQRLDIAADLTDRICQSIRTATGFHTTGGISVSPLLAKLASGLHKPKSVNVLLPWRSSQLIYSMPLRKMHKIGHATAKALEKQIAFEEGTFGLSNRRSLDVTTPKGQKMQTVLDVLELPRSLLREAIQGLSGFQSDTSSDEHCELLIQQCRGLDTSNIVDDNAGLPKSVSVENSFRRGTLRTELAVMGAMEDLYRRLPLLLKDRASWAKEPKKSYPNTIRLTVRFLLDPQMSSTNQRRSSRVTSRQTTFDGLRYLVQETDLRIQSETIKKHVLPMLRDMLLPRIDVTRINIAVTGFQDVAIAKAQELNGSVQISLDHSRIAHLGSCIQMTQCTPASATQLTQSMTRRTTPETPSHKRANVPRAHPTSSLLSQLSSKRMKTTRIDQFFGKK